MLLFHFDKLTAQRVVQLIPRLDDLRSFDNLGRDRFRRFRGGMMTRRTRTRTRR